MKTTLLQARKIITMNPSRPLATHVAVRDGRILGTGALEELAGWGPYELDSRLAAKVLMPGLVEGHSHLMEGGFWRFVYCGFFERSDPDGKLWSGAKSLDAVLQRLNEAQAALPDASTPLAGWGFDPIYFYNRRCVREDLDRVDDAAGGRGACQRAHRQLQQRRASRHRLAAPRHRCRWPRCWAWTARCWPATRPRFVPSRGCACAPA